MKPIQYLRDFNHSTASFDTGMLLFRVFASLQLIVVHGLKKVGIGTQVAETVANPLDLPDWFNGPFAIASNLVFPLFVMAGLCTRLACLPILAVTLTGYFIVHRADPLLMSDIPFMYSLCFLLIAFCGPGMFSFDNFFKK